MPDFRQPQNPTQLKQNLSQGDLQSLMLEKIRELQGLNPNVAPAQNVTPRELFTSPENRLALGLQLLQSNTEQPVFQQLGTGIALGVQGINQRRQAAIEQEKESIKSRRGALLQEISALGDAAKLSPKPVTGKLTSADGRRLLVDPTTGERIADIGELPQGTQRVIQAPSGFAFVNPSDPKQGLIPIPGGPADRLTPEQAAKAQLVQNAMENADLLDRFIFEANEDGTTNFSNPNRTNIANANAPFGGTPFTEGRSLNALIKDAIEAKIRAESGAAVPETEVSRASERFTPSVLDSNETIQIKRKIFRDFINGTYDKFDPTGRFQRTKTIDKVVEQLNKEIGVAPKISKQDRIKNIKTMINQ